MTREDAIHILRTRIVPTRSWQETYEAIDMAREALSAEVVQGEWVRKVKEYNDCDGHRFVYWYECDQCGARPPKDQWKNEWHSNYCPSCGARMENKE